MGRAVSPDQTNDEFCDTFSQFLDCAYGELVGNGHCNDEANNANCIYDESECCGACINTENCAECFCHEEAALAIDLTCK